MMRHLITAAVALTLCVGAAAAQGTDRGPDAIPYPYQGQPRYIDVNGNEPSAQPAPQGEICPLKTRKPHVKSCTVPSRPVVKKEPPTMTETPIVNTTRIINRTVVERHIIYAPEIVHRPPPRIVRGCAGPCQPPMMPQSPCAFNRGPCQDQPGPGSYGPPSGGFGPQGPMRASLNAPVGDPCKPNERLVPAPPGMQTTSGVVCLPIRQ